MKKFAWHWPFIDDAASIEAYEHWHKSENLDRNYSILIAASL